MGVYLLETAQADLELLYCLSIPVVGVQTWATIPCFNEDLDKLHHNAWLDFNLFTSLKASFWKSTSLLIKHLFNRLSCLTLDKLKWPHFNPSTWEMGVLEWNFKVILFFSMHWSGRCLIIGTVKRFLSPHSKVNHFTNLSSWTQESLAFTGLEVKTWVPHHNGSFEETCT